MKKTLMPFQEEGAAFLAARTRALLADEMGLGKTISALAAVEKLGLSNVLVICPASVRSNWAKEIRECGLNPDNFLVMSYNSAVSLIPPPSDAGVLHDVIIIDECHFLKSVDSLRSLAVFGNETGLARRCARIWALTGTPVLNRPRELYPLLKAAGGEKVLGPWNSWGKFTQHFCGAFFDGRGINTKGATNLTELADRLKGFMLRRTKAEVLPQLPPKVISLVPMELTAAELTPIFDIEAGILNREAYLSATTEDYAQLGDMARLDKAVGLAKARKIGAFVEDMMDSGVDKIVIFTKHREVLRILDQELGHHLPASYQGGMSDEQKKEAVEEFKTNKNCGVFIGQLQAAGTGINGLQDVCSHVVFAETSWVPGEMAQAIDRLHRIGQGASSVNVYVPFVPGTLEEAKLQVRTGKERVIDRLMEVNPSVQHKDDSAVVHAAVGRGLHGVHAALPEGCLSLPSGHDTKSDNGRAPSEAFKEALKGLI